MVSKTMTNQFDSDVCLPFHKGVGNMKYGFVVEGFNDEKRLREFFAKYNMFTDAHFVVTKGTRLDGRTKLDMANLLENVDKVYVLTDPDEAGDVLYGKLNEMYNLDKLQFKADKCRCYRRGRMKVGVEHAYDDHLLEVFSVLT